MRGGEKEKNDSESNNWRENRGIRELLLNYVFNRVIGNTKNRRKNTSLMKFAEFSARTIGTF